MAGASRAWRMATEAVAPHTTAVSSMARFLSTYIEIVYDVIPTVGMRELSPPKRLELHELRDREEETVRP